MQENQADTPKEPSKQTLDLSTLSGLDFGPSWTDKSAGQTSRKRSSDQNSRSKQSSGGGKRDRRGPSGGNYSRGGESGKSNSGKGNSYNREGRRNWSQSQRDDFQPTATIDIYPQDDAFDALVKRLRSTVRTYQLFEIANLILEKPERYIVVVQNKAKKDEKPKPLYYTLPEYLPFETEEAATNHALNNHLELFFDIEEIQVEPPKGNFQMVNRCAVTGELLGPPNYHRYQGFLQSHYASRINNMSFDHFVSKVESVKDQESIDAWVESMKKGAKYTLKERKEGEPESFESLEAVRSFLLQHRKDAIIGTGEIVRFSGRDVEQLPKGAIRRSIEMYMENQLHFPLDTANNIRGRLRRHKFTVYKKGSKGVSYVCAVKRKFRDSKTVFAPSIQEVIKFIEKHPNVPASKLPKLHLGIDTDKQKPAKLEMAESEIAEGHTDAPDPTEAEDKVNETAAVQTTEAAVSASPDAAPSTVEATPKSALGEEDLKRLNQLILDLRWLVAEGYVTEYGDGRLFASPPIPEPKPKASKSPDATESEPEKAVDEEPEADEEPAASQPDDETVSGNADKPDVTAEAPSESEEKS